MPDPQPDLAAILDRKFAELETMAMRNAIAYGSWRRRFERLHFALGIPTTLLAAVAGATAFAEHAPSILVGSCATIAAALAGVQTTVRPDRRAKFNQTQQFVLARLSVEASNFRELILPTVSFEVAQAKLDTLYDAFHATLAVSPN
jgi:hypothetical protein